MLQHHSGTLLTKIRHENPLIHCITNHVVANFQANGLLALGASPIMADSIEEMTEIASIASCSVFNIGTLRSSTLEVMLLAGQSANAHRRPLVLDPVGAGATFFRKSTVFQLLSSLKFDLIRGNAGELAAIAGIEWESKGVDAGEGKANVEDIAQTVASTHNCIVAITGKQDIVTDGTTTHIIEGGHPLLTQVTGTGCLLSAIAGSFLAVTPAKEQYLEATVAALTMYKRIAERAAKNAKGPGDFAVHLLNELHSYS